MMLARDPYRLKADTASSTVETLICVNFLM
jgi:hypothetical protein